MNVETALSAIKEWYCGEPYQIEGITAEKYGTTDGFDQMEEFINVFAWQESVGDSGDSFRGQAFFEFEAGKFIKTSFWI